jgi:hypothetical protein
LQYIELPQSLRAIDTQAFYGCYNLAMTETSPYDLNIGGIIYSIGEKAFSLGGNETSNSKITNIYIGPNVKYIHGQAFAFIDRQVNNIYLGNSSAPTQLTHKLNNLDTYRVFDLNSYGPYSTLTAYCENAEHHKIIEDYLETLYNGSKIIINSFAYRWGENGKDDDNNTLDNDGDDEPNQDEGV